MNVEVLTIGTELLLGFTIDTNGAHIARTLGEIGVQVVRRASVGDRGQEIRDAVQESLARTGAVVTTGGLGPTRDDITKRAVADLYGAPLDFREDIWQALVERFARLGRVAPAVNRLQAEVPRGATVLPNKWGTAPGLWLEDARGFVVMLPGVPREMRKLLEHEVVPRLRVRAGGRVIRSRIVRTSGIPESLLAERLGDIEERVSPLTLAYLPGYDGVDLRLTAWDTDLREADRALEAGVRLINERAGDHAYGEGDTDLAAVLLDQARARGLRIAVAESCTGGLLGKRLTDTPGSSDVFVGGVIAYANEVKTSLLDVEPVLLERHGAVSAEVVCAMALGVAKRLGVPFGISVTGIAGPGGGTEAKPVGTIWLATALQGTTQATHIMLPGSREEIRLRAAQAGLLLGVRRLSATSAGR
ncbi:MAG TPA: competence/damage-inducible protein A [Gemmatimonadales bacterium]|nr:competence/damage-inducible protein A [Gemmatimonadales bacterium]